MKYVYLIFCILLSACSPSSSKMQKTSINENVAHLITVKTAQKIKNETGLHLCGTGGGSSEGLLRKLNMCFDHYGEITMEEGRELLIYCVQEYLSAINASQEIKSSLLHYPFTPKDVEIIIYVRGADKKRVDIGEYNVINANGGRLIYTIRQPDPEGMKRIHQETFEEAVKLVEAQDSKMELIKKSKVSLNVKSK